MSRICFVDTETTGLDREHHRIWEVALITRDVEAHNDVPRRWLLPLSDDDLRRADPVALKMTRFPERHPQGQAFVGTERCTTLSAFAANFTRETEGAHLVGAVPSFDEERLWRLLRSADAGFAAPWHYHLVDVEVLAAGYLGGRGYVGALSLPWDSEDLSRAVGVEPSRFDRHTAMGDAEWARAIYDAVMRP